MAMQKVFDTEELLQQILYALPPIDILIQQRTCRKFQRIIKDSKFQKALFFEAVCDDVLDFGNTTPYQNRFAPTQPPYKQAWRFSSRPSPQEPQFMFINPMLDKLYKAVHDARAWDAVRAQREMTPIGLLPASWQVEEASWKRMLVTQPPSAIRLIVTTVFECKCWDCYVTGGNKTEKAHALPTRKFPGLSGDAKATTAKNMSHMIMAFDLREKADLIYGIRIEGGLRVRELRATEELDSLPKDDPVFKRP